MRQVKFGRTGLFVSELCLGTMTFGGQGIWKSIGTVRQAEANDLVERAIKSGINFIDTADVYSNGLAEEIVGRAITELKISRDDLVIATKAFGEMGRGSNARGMSRFHLINAAQASLRRLSVNHIDVYQVHGFDPATPIEEAVRAMDRLVQDGYVRYVGLSNWAAWQIAKALGIAERHDLARPEAVQAYYTVEGRGIEREIVPMLQSEGMALMVWGPLAGGLLSGKYNSNQVVADDARRRSFDFPPVDRTRVKTCIDKMSEIAEEKGITVAQVALAWLLHQPIVTSVITGVRSLEQLQENIAATEVRLTREEIEALSAISPPPSEYPGWSLALFAESRQKQLDESSRSRQERDEKW